MPMRKPIGKWTPALIALILAVMSGGCFQSASGPLPTLTPIVITNPPAPTPVPATPTLMPVYVTLTALVAGTPTPIPFPPTATMMMPGTPGPLQTGEPPLVTPTQAPGTLEAAEGECTHILQPGENLFRLSLRWGVTVEELAAYNGIADPDNVQAGTVIRVPGCEEGAYTAQPQEGAGRTYTVRPGDTLFSIAQRHGVTVEALQEANGISDPNQLRAGQVLIIP